MLLKSLGIKNFRNLQPVQLQPGKFLNVFLGGNGQGKTSILEAIYFGCHLKSFRTHHYQDLIQFSQNTSQIDMRFRSANTDHAAQVRFGVEGNRIILDNKKVSKKTYLGRLNAVAFSPDSLMIVKGGSEEKRRQLDETAAMIFREAVDCQTQFERSLRQKNASLKSLKSGASLSEVRDMVASLNQVLIPLAADVLFLRFKVIQELIPRMEKVLAEITGKKSTVAIKSFTHKNEWSEFDYPKIKERIEAEINDPTNRVIEENIGHSLAGPHRQEIQFFLNEKDTRFFSSQGESRAFILAFKMAEIVYHSEALGAYPILLLDDVLSEFDEDKQGYLLDFLQKNEAQTFLTATHTTSRLKDAEVFHLTAGMVTRNGNREDYGNSVRI